MHAIACQFVVWHLCWLICYDFFQHVCTQESLISWPVSIRLILMRLRFLCSFPFDFSIWPAMLLFLSFIAFCFARCCSARLSKAKMSSKMNSKKTRILRCCAQCTVHCIDMPTDTFYKFMNNWRNMNIKAKQLKFQLK